MSIYSRDYMREEPRKRGGDWSIVTWLLVINIAIYVVDLLLSSKLQDWFGLSLANLGSGMIWTPLTYQFVHSSPMHIIFNMIGLFFFGRNLLMIAGPKHVLRIYLLGGLFGGALQLLWSLLMSDGAHIVGASGSVLALLFAVVTLMPNQPHRLIFPPVTITPKLIAILIIGINCLTLLLSIAAPNPNQPETAVMAHFGGMLVGWLYVKKGFHLAASRRSGSARPRKRSRSRQVPGAIPEEAGRGEKKFGFVTIRRVDEEEPGEKKPKPFVTDEIDAILDKINEKGFQSLTREEKKLLDKSSKKLSKRGDKKS
jgi:membrane associated rhomboid family serine protease